MDLRSGAAFWPIRNGLLHTYPRLHRDETADVAVIGAGITGALVAHRLASLGANVVVVDKRDVASGSTSATTGLLLCETDLSLTELKDAVGEEHAVRAWKLGLEAIDDIAALCGTIEKGEGSCGFDRRSSLYLASSRRDARALAAEHALRARHGFDVEWLSSADIRGRYGIEAPAAIAGHDGAQIDSFAFTHGVLRAAAACGARIYDRTEVCAVNARRNDVVLKTAPGARIAARRIVWASGYEAIEETQRRVGRMSSTWAVVSEPIEDFGPWRDKALIWETARPYLYARSTDDNRVMLGGEDEPFSKRHADLRLLGKKAGRLRDRFARLFPSIPIEIAYRWAGVFTTTKDGLPYIGSVRKHPHAWLALGYGGNGITFSMIAAQLIGDAWRGKWNPDAQIFAFDR